MGRSIISFRAALQDACQAMMKKNDEVMKKPLWGFAGYAPWGAASAPPSGGLAKIDEKNLCLGPQIWLRQIFFIAFSNFFS